jgi:tRNA(Arg) A34 adenosine deaminase TadA
VNDAEGIARAIALARANVAEGGGPFGALVVRGGRVLGSGANRVVPSADPTAHAEVVAIRAACARIGTHELAGCTLFASSEPCPMCLAAAYWARVERLVFAATRADAAAAGFDDERLYAELGLPLERRSLPTVRLAHPAARSPFDEWAAKADRAPY